MNESDAIARTIKFSHINDTQEVFKIICEDVLEMSFQDVKRKFLPESDPNISKIRFTELMTIIAKAGITFKTTLFYTTGLTRTEVKDKKAESEMGDLNETLHTSDLHEKIMEDKKSIKMPEISADPSHEPIERYNGPVMKDGSDPSQLPPPPEFD